MIARDENSLALLKEKKVELFITPFYQIILHYIIGKNVINFFFNYIIFKNLKCNISTYDIFVLHECSKYVSK